MERRGDDVRRRSRAPQPGGCRLSFSAGCYGACVGTGANQDYNQGVCVNLLDPNDPLNGTFDCYASKEFVDPAGAGGLNVTATNTPNKRPLVTGSTEETCTTNSPPTYYNHPFNFAISDGAKKIIVK